MLFIKKFISKSVLTISTIVCLSTLTPARADSPLTSTDFYRAYEDVPLVLIAKRGRLTPELLAALGSPAISNDTRAAIVNALGYKFEGQKNARIYLDFIAEERGKSPDRLTLSDLTPRELFSLGYLLAMDDYFTLKAVGGTGEVQRTDALTLLQKAVDRSPNDFTVAMIYELAKAQILLGNAQLWCKIYRDVSKVADGEGQKNMRPGAIGIIMEYINLYKQSC